MLWPIINNSSKSLASRLQVILYQSNLTQPVVGIGSKLALRITPQKSYKSLSGTLKVACLDQAIRSFIILLLFFWIPRLGRNLLLRTLAGLSTLLLLVNGSCIVLADAAIKRLEAIFAVLFQAADTILLLLKHATQRSNFLLHLLQLQEQLALRRQPRTIIGVQRRGNTEQGRNI